MTQVVRTPTRLIQILVLISIVGGLLLGACNGQASIDLNLDGGGEGDGGGGAASNSTLFTLMIVLFLAVAALVLVAGRRG